MRQRELEIEMPSSLSTPSNFLLIFRSTSLYDLISQLDHSVLNLRPSCHRELALVCLAMNLATKNAEFPKNERAEAEYETIGASKRARLTKNRPYKAGYFSVSRNEENNFSVGARDVR